MFVAALYGIGAYVATIVAWFSIVLGRGYPPGLYEFNVRYIRMASRANAFFFLATDELPPFDGEPNDSYPVHVDIDPDSGEHDRLSVALRALYLIPVFIVIWAVSLVVYAGAIFAWIMIVFTGRTPEDAEQLIAKGMASITRATGYALLLTDVYPPVWDTESMVVLPGSAQPAAVPPAGSPVL
jgi:hypothetical protein